MKKVIYRSLYNWISMLSNRFNSKLLIKIKVALGTALLVLTSSCSSGANEPEVMCYIMIEPMDSVELQLMPVPENSVETGEI